MALGRVVLAWAAVGGWLVLWALAEWRWAGGPALTPHGASWLGGEALLLSLFGALWFASLGAGAWWLIFLLVGALVEWPLRSVLGAARVTRVVASGGLLAWALAP